MHCAIAIICPKYFVRIAIISISLIRFTRSLIDGSSTLFFSVTIAVVAIFSNISLLWIAFCSGLLPVMSGSHHVSSFLMQEQKNGKSTSIRIVNLGLYSITSLLLFVDRSQNIALNKHLVSFFIFYEFHNQRQAIFCSKCIQIM